MNIIDNVDNTWHAPPTLTLLQTEVITHNNHSVNLLDVNCQLDFHIYSLWVKTLYGVRGIFCVATDIINEWTNESANKIIKGPESGC